MTERGEELVLHPADPLGLGARSPLALQQALALLLGLFSLRHVAGHRQLPRLAAGQRDRDGMGLHPPPRPA